MELSTEFSVLRFESLSINGARMLLGSLVTSGERLLYVSWSRQLQIQENMPFDC
jgi:hypothetical protein